MGLTAAMRLFQRRCGAGGVFDGLAPIVIKSSRFQRQIKLTMTKRKAKIYYTALDDFWRKEEKLEWLRDNPIEKIAFEHITPDEKHNWLFDDNDFDTLLPLVSKEAKAGKNDFALFQLYSLGVSTNRDEWITDLSSKNLQEKMKFFVSEYDKAKSPEERQSIKWSSTLQSRFNQKRKEKFNKEQIKPILYRPYYKQFVYFSELFIDRPANSKELFLQDNKTILCCYGERLDFCALATNHIPSLNFFSLEVAQAVSLYRYDENNERHDNITDWALIQFKTNYKDINSITKEDIFYYTHAVLHSPVYRKKYEQNLKREFPRLPFYADFFQWRDWGAELMDLHINYETVEPFALERNDLDSSAKRKIKQENLFGGKLETENEIFIFAPNTKLRADKTKGTIEIDSHTTLTGVPALAWEYKLGNRSAIEWILDQYKERKPKDATIAEHFDAYKFADYKEHVIDLLVRVTTVSVKTMKIVNRMPNE